MPAALTNPKPAMFPHRLADLSKTHKAAARELMVILGRFVEEFNEMGAAQIVVAALEEELDRRPTRRSAMAAALTRGALAREQLKQEEGGSFSAEEARRLLGLSKESVLKRYRSGMLLGWREARQEAVRFPVWQFSNETENHLLPGLDRVLGILRGTETLDDWGRILFFLNPRGSLERKRPLDLLRDCRIEPVLAAAHAAIE